MRPASRAACSDRAAAPAVQRAIEAATANILTAFGAGPAGRAHPAHELIPTDRWPAATAGYQLNHPPSICLQFWGLWHPKLQTNPDLARWIGLTSHGSILMPLSRVG